MDNVQLFAVSRQAARVREGLTAGGAYVGAVAGMGAHVLRQGAVQRESLAAGGACVGAVTGMGALVSRQASGLREGLATDGALKDELAPRPAPPPLARPSMATTCSVAKRLLPFPLATDHRKINRLVLRPPDRIY